MEETEKIKHEFAKKALDVYKLSIENNYENTINRLMTTTTPIPTVPTTDRHQRLYKILPNDKWEFFFDNHTLGVFETCERKFSYQSLPSWRTETDGGFGVLRGKGKLPWAVQLGIWWSDVMQDYYDLLRLDQTKSLPTLQLTKVALAQSASKHWTKLGMDEYAVYDPTAYAAFGGGAFTPLNFNGNLIKVPFGAIQMTFDYFDRYEYSDRREWTVLGTEAGFGLKKEVKVGETDKVVVYYTGRPDLLVQERRSGKVLVVDHKTTDDITERYKEQWKPHDQFPGYVYAVNEMLRELGSKDGGQPFNRTNSFIVNAAARIQHTDKKTGNKKPRFVRLPLTFSSSEIEEWKSDVMAQAEDMRKCIETNHFSKREIMCHNQYGRPCEYRPICKLPPENRLTAIKSNYQVVEPWTPY